jgi:integrase
VSLPDLRHTYASTLLSAGVSIAAVAGWLGHDSPTTTLRTYSHMMPVDADKGRQAIEAAFGRRAEDSLRTAED